MINNTVYATEVIHSLNNIIHTHTHIRNANCICLEDMASLLMRKFTSLHVIGVVRKVNLCTMIYPTLQPHFFLFTKYFQQWHNMLFLATFLYNCILWNVPCFTRQKSTFKLSLTTIISHGSLTYTMQQCIFADRYKFHYRQVFE